MRTPSIRVRLAAMFTLLVAVIVVGVGVATYQLLRQTLLDEIERDVARRATTFRLADLRPPYDLDVFGAPDVFLQVVDGDGGALARSGNLGERVLPLPEAARRGEVVGCTSAHPQTLRDTSRCRRILADQPTDQLVDNAGGPVARNRAAAPG